MSNSTEMVERVARAAAKAAGNFNYDGFGEESKAKYDRIARAAIEAMREPTQAMLDYANETVRPDSDNAQCPDFYRAMISAALSPADEGSQRK